MPHCITAQFHALPGVDFSLAVQWQMFSELRHNDTGQQARTGVTTPDGFRWQRCLHDTVVLTAASLGRTVSLTLKAVLMISSCSEMLSPSDFSFPLQTGHSVSGEAITCLSRGRVAGSALRVGESDAFGAISPAIEVSCECASPSLFWSPVIRFSACAIFFSIFSRFFSLLRPNSIL